MGYVCEKFIYRYGLHMLLSVQLGDAGGIWVLGA